MVRRPGSRPGDGEAHEIESEGALPLRVRDEQSSRPHRTWALAGDARHQAALYELAAHGYLAEVAR
jgi:hypothetical protein